MSGTLNAQSRFQTFVVGSANRLAVTAGRAVAESPGAVYNPLFVYAPPGLGKTHLLMAIGHGALAINPRLSVEYLTLDEFVESFHGAIAAGQGEAYRRRFLDVDLLLVDDVQFLTHRREMQAELLRLVDALQTAGRQIVLTSDRAPADIEALDERLIRRFAGGLVIDIAAPDYETRVAILRRRADERRVVFGDGVLEAVATADIDNVRELIGALNRLIAFQAVSETPLDPAQARILVGAPPVAPAAVPTPDEPVAPASSAPQQAPPDEFGDFLLEVTATLSHQVETWRARVGEAILRWEGEGYRTARLAALLDSEAPADPEEELRAYAADIVRLQQLQDEIAALAPELGGSPLLRDPDALSVAEALVERARAGRNPPPAPSPLWQLADIVESAGNRMAVRAVGAVLPEPGLKYNPLVIVGTSGVGKTHLLHALGNALPTTPDAPVACMGTDEFVAELIDAIDRDRVSAWRARYRRVSAFLLDDIHLIAGKERTQDELFWLFNFLVESNRQMAFTTAVPLAELAGVEARLLTRLEGGLVVELPAPDRELRQEVVQRLLAARSEPADPELAPYLAARPADSVRSVQGLVQRVLNAADVHQQPPTAALAREVLEGTARPARRSGGQRASGGVIVASSGVKSREKMVWSWPDVAERAIEEWR